MYDQRIDAAPLSVDLHDGFPDAIDLLSVGSLCRNAFLRSSWYSAGAGGEGHTLIAKRADGAILAAIPTTKMGPSLIGVKKVPGSYWPFRSVLVARDALAAELAEVFTQATARRALGPIWRIGPVPANDATTGLVTSAAALAGWSVLERRVGKSWLLNLQDLGRDSAWPSKSTAKRLRQYERRLSERGQLAWRHVTGADWDQLALDQMAQVERESWVGTKTDQSGAKFLQDHQRALWQHALADPEIAACTSATILLLDERPIAFSFDLFSGTTQYAIASSFAEEFGEYRVGRLVTYHQLQMAREAGIATVDLGAGDSGYKRQMGAAEGYEFVDLLIVGNRLTANMLALKWGKEPEHLQALRDEALPASGEQKTPWQLITASAALAGTAIAIAE